VRSYILSDQGIPISLKDARECSHRTTAVEGIREGKGEAACTVLQAIVLYLTSPVNKARERLHVQYYRL
jgi:hypothetical protein